MSDSQAYEEVTVASDGVTVVKRFEEDEFPVPAIAFEFTSSRDEEVTVRLRDVVPEGVAVEDLGFHPEYGSEFWTIDEDEISFEKDLGANSEYTTVYGIRATGAEDVEQFLTEPTLEEVDPPLPEEEKSDAVDDVENVVPESDDDVLRDAISGEGEIPGLDEGEEPAEDEEVEKLDLADPNNEGGAATASEAPAATEPEEAETEATSEDETEAEAETVEQDIAVDGSLVGALATELRQNNVSADDVKLLRRAFEIAGEEGGSIKARLQRIQTDLADLRAYTDALEQFLDENGTGEQLIEDFDQQLDEFEQTLERVETRVEETDGTVTDVTEELSEVSAEVDEMSSELDEMQSEVEEVTGEMDEVSEEVKDVSEEVDEVSDDVEEVSDDVEDVETTVTDLEESVADIEDELDEVREQVTDADVVERLDDIEEDIADLRDWQEQIKSTFGG